MDSKRLAAAVNAIPIIGPRLRRALRRVGRRRDLTFEKSDQYWEDRYRLGGTSGSGSYGRLAEFKASVVNAIVEEKKISTVVEFGCGDGSQLSLARYPQYVGFDVSSTSIEICREKFASNSNYKFYVTRSPEFKNLAPAELSLSLDVIFHLVEDRVFEEYMEKLFRSATRMVVIYAYDKDITYAFKHERGRKFTTWVSNNAPNWRLIRVIPNKYPHDALDPDGTSQSSFFLYEPI